MLTKIYRVVTSSVKIDLMIFVLFLGGLTEFVSYIPYSLSGLDVIWYKGSSCNAVVHVRCVTFGTREGLNFLKAVKELTRMCIP